MEVKAMRLEVQIKNRSRESLRNGCPQLPDLSEWEGNKEIAELELWRIHHMAQVCLLFLDSGDHQFLYERASDLYVKVISKEELYRRRVRPLLKSGAAWWEIPRLYPLLYEIDGYLQRMLEWARDLWLYAYCAAGRNGGAR
jgi:hypothetical protein